MNINNNVSNFVTTTPKVHTKRKKKKKERNVSVDTIQYIPAEDLLYISSLE